MEKENKTLEDLGSILFNKIKKNVIYERFYKPTLEVENTTGSAVLTYFYVDRVEDKDVLVLLWSYKDKYQEAHSNDFLVGYVGTFTNLLLIHSDVLLVILDTLGILNEN